MNKHLVKYKVTARYRRWRFRRPDVFVICMRRVRSSGAVIENGGKVLSLSSRSFFTVFSEERWGRKKFILLRAAKRLLPDALLYKHLENTIRRNPSGSGALIKGCHGRWRTLQRLVFNAPVVRLNSEIQVGAEVCGSYWTYLNHLGWLYEKGDISCKQVKLLFCKSMWTVAIVIPDPCHWWCRVALHLSCIATSYGWGDI